MRKIKEKIICSAIWYKELPLINPKALEARGFRPYNVDKGIVFCGWRHHNCLYQMVALTGKPSYDAGESIQGFLTNKNRFMDRNEAAEMWVKNGGKLHYGTQLYSEDIY